MKSPERLSLDKTTERGVLILECIDQSDLGSEGRFLSHMFDLMDVPCQYVEIRTPEQLLSLLGCSPYKYIHITTHGYVTESSKKFIGWWTPNGIVKKKILQPLEGKLINKIIVSTACNSAEKGFCDYIVDRLGCKHYIAPARNPKFHNSIMFAHLFYHKVFILRLSAKNSYKRYEQNYKNPHLFSIYNRKNRSTRSSRRTTSTVHGAEAH
jgi:hypothetical protein